VTIVNKPSRRMANATPSSVIVTEDNLLA